MRLDGMRVDFLVPRPLEGSGGHRTVYRNAAALSAAGARVRLHLESGGRRALRRAEQLFGAEGLVLSPGWPGALGDSDLVVATTWQSALAVGGIATDARKAHFVQDYECWFYPRGDAWLAASRAHDLGLQAITIGSWLPRVLWREHGLGARSVPFTADLTCYRPRSDARGEARTRRVVAMYQPEKPRRCPELMRAALARVLAADPNLEVVTVGSKWSPGLGSRHKHLGLVAPDRLAALYREADVGFSISLSNPSRVPFEMMACGLPVVEVGADNTAFDLPGQGCLLARPDPVSMAEAILRIAGDRDLAARLSEGGRSFMAERPAAAEQSAFVAAVAAIAGGEGAGEPVGEPLYGGEIVAASDPDLAALTGARSLAARIRRRLIQLGL